MSAAVSGVAFKVESHNHPSAVEPFQGAATGVGGILRDVFAVGARPIAVLDSLRFGEPDLRPLALPARPGGGRASATTATRSASRRSAARSTSSPATSRTVSSTRCAWAWRRHERLIRSAAAGRRQRAGAVRCARPAATASAAPRCWPAPSSARTTRPSARRSRSAIRSRRRSCSSAGWSCSTAGCWSRCRTSARPG